MQECPQARTLNKSFLSMKYLMIIEIFKRKKSKKTIICIMMMKNLRAMKKEKNKFRRKIHNMSFKITI